MNEIYLVSSGDLRLSANQKCWEAQAEMEQALQQAVARHGYQIQRAHPFDEQEQHGFISSQRQGIDIFRNIPAEAPVMVAEAVMTSLV